MIVTLDAQFLWSTVTFKSYLYKLYTCESIRIVPYAISFCYTLITFLLVTTLCIISYCQ